MRRTTKFSVKTAAAMLAVAAASAVSAQTHPASAPAAGDGLSATITAVQGFAQVRDGADKPWRKAEVNGVLAQDAEIRTGPKSAVQLVIQPDQTITLDRLGTLTLVELAKNGNKVKTNLGMKYGRTRFDIEAAGIEHEASISSPSSTLAIRGTRVSLYDQLPFRVEAVSLTGRAQFRDGKKQLAFGGKNAGKTKVAGGQPSAAALAIENSTVDPTLANARSASEVPLVDTLISRGSTVFFDRTAGIEVVKGGVPPTDAELIPTLPGQLNFVLRWNTDSDLNFSVGSPGGKNNEGEILYPVAGLNVSANGGKIPFDHRGGPNGGIELAYWQGKVPEGLYGLGIILASGSQTTATVDAFLGGQKIDIWDGQQFVSTATVDVLPPQPGISEGTAAGIVGIGVDIPGADGGNNPPPPGGGNTPPGGNEPPPLLEGKKKSASVSPRSASSFDSKKSVKSSQIASPRSARSK